MTYTETRYVNVNIGSDTTGDGSKATPFASIEYCVSQLVTTAPLVVIEEGVYPVSYLNNMSVVNKDITFKGKNQRTIIEIQEVKSSQWLSNTIISNCIIRPSDTYSGDTRALSYTSDSKNIVYRNVCFTKSLNGNYPTSTFFFTDTSGTGYTGKDFYNCSFIGNILTIGAGGGRLNNCAIMYGSVYGGTLTNTILNCLFDSKYNIIDSTGNTINNDIYGIYSGDFKWSSNVLLKFNEQYYSINNEFYDIDTKQYQPLENVNFIDNCFDLSDLFYYKSIGGVVNNITPIMTSNNTPSPYVITSSSQYNTTTYLPWKAFNGTNTSIDDCWVTANTKTGWIMIDFNIPVKINSFHITSRFRYTTDAPKDFTLQGSNDGADFTIIKDVVNQTEWLANETKSYKLDNDATYRYYKLNVTSINSGNFIAIAGIKFLYTSPLLDTFKPIDKFNNFKLVTNEKDAKIAVNATKYDKQLIVASDDIPTSIALSIDYFKLTSTVSENADLRIALSIDKGKTWKAWNAVTKSYEDLMDIVIPLKPYSTFSEQELHQWKLVTESIAENGITPEVFNSLDFNLLNSETIRFAYVLIRPDYNDRVETSQLDWQFDAKGTMRKLTDSEHIVDLYEHQIKVTSLVENPLMKVNIMV